LRRAKYTIEKLPDPILYST